MTKYTDQYKDSRWHARRQEILRRDMFTCKCCGVEAEDGETLQVHHAYYDQSLAIWEYDDEALVTLCRPCHSFIHAVKKNVLLWMSGMSEAGLIRLNDLTKTDLRPPKYSHYELPRGGIMSLDCNNGW